MLVSKKYPYEKLERIDSPNGRRYICPDGTSVASVTTILDKTKSQESKDGLDQWRARVGAVNAQQITTEAANRGTMMHKFLECWISGTPKIPGSNFGQQQASKMANVLIDTYLKPNLTEVWGIEATLYYPGKYAGTTDCVGMWAGIPTIVDFKQTNKPKKEEYIQDYYAQLAAYASAHNKLYDTQISQGVVVMCSADFQPQLFILRGEQFAYHQTRWWDRVNQFYI